jgi:GntR family transcriptional regulator/MocR family aminotransferase
MARAAEPRKVHIPTLPWYQSLRVLWLPLDGDGPLHRQTYRALRSAILEGRLPAGARLASSRTLARELGVSRNTVLQAFEQLVAEGYASAREGSGTFVAQELPRRASSKRAARSTPASDGPRLSAIGRRIAQAIPRGHATWSLPRENVRYDFRYGEPAYADLPLATWARLLGRRARRLSVKRLAYQPPGGAAELREALAGYLARARGVVCGPEQIVVVQGSQQAIDLCARLLVDPGDRVVLEEPHYTGFSFCFAAAGAELVHVPADEQGLQVEALAALPAARVACVTPSHHFPAGGVLSLPRRLALLEWAAERSAYVLEDDYDGEFRFDGRPLECLQSLDRHGRVIYLGTASKLMFPALRIGWIVAPPDLVPSLQDLKALTDTGTATLEQLAFADFIREGHLERHIRRARLRHAARRRTLLQAVERELGERALVVGTSAGLHVLLRLPGLSAREVSRLRAACRERDVGVYPAAPFYARPPSRAELLLGYASLDEAEIRAGIRRLREAVESLA